MPRTPGGTPAVRSLLDALCERGVVDGNGRPPNARKIERCWADGIGPRITGKDTPAPIVIEHYATVLPAIGRGLSNDRALVLAAVFGRPELVDEAKARSAWRRLLHNYGSAEADPDKVVELATSALHHGDAPILAWLARNLREHGKIPAPYETGAGDDEESPRQANRSVTFDLAELAVHGAKPARPDLIRRAMGVDASSLSPLAGLYADSELAALELVAQAPFLDLVATSRMGLVIGSYAKALMFSSPPRRDEVWFFILGLGPSLVTLCRIAPDVYQSVVDRIATVLPLDDDERASFQAMRDSVEKAASNAVPTS